MEMKKPALVKICKDGGFYRSPELNDVLYFHYKGFVNIDEIQEYTNAKCIWLEGNAIEKIENLDELVKVRQLYLQENCIKKIEGLQCLSQLVSVNLSHNFITKVENLEGLTSLKTLNLKGNRLKRLEDITHLLELPSIETIDLTANHLEDEAVLNEVFSKIPTLLSLYSHQNPFCKKIPSYRKTSIGKCKALRYLDDRPVFTDERRCTDAFMVGGLDAERAERAKINQEESDKNERNRMAFKELIKNAKKEKEELKAKGLDRPPNTEFHVDNYMKEPTAEDKWFTEQRSKNKKNGEPVYTDPMQVVAEIKEEQENRANKEKTEEPPTAGDPSPPPADPNRPIVHSTYCKKDPPPEKPVRPMVWGTPAYEELWKKAVAASHEGELEIEEID